MCDSLEKFKADGSGCRLDDILILEQTIIKFNPLRGSYSDYTMLERLARRACLINVVGTPAYSMDCFCWAVLAGLHLPPHITGEIHWAELSQYSNTLSFEGIENRGKKYHLRELMTLKRKTMSVLTFWDTLTNRSRSICRKIETSRQTDTSIYCL